MWAGTTRRSFVGMAAAWATLAACRRAFAQRRALRLAMSTETLTSNNLADARAAYKVWIDQIFANFSERRIDVLPQLFYPSAQILEMIRAGQVDCITLTAMEYSRVLDQLETSSAVIERYASSGLDYVLLVHSSSPYQKLEDLKRCSLVVHRHRDTGLLRNWLSLALAAARQPEPGVFFESIDTREKINEILLPLFFHKVQAAALCRRSFSMAAELNPQLGRDLRVLAASPKVVPVGMWFRKGTNETDKQELLGLLEKMGSVPAGRQILTMYESTGVTVQPGSLMNATLDLIRQWERLKRS